MKLQTYVKCFIHCLEEFTIRIALSNPLLGYLLSAGVSKLGVCVAEIVETWCRRFNPPERETRTLEMPCYSLCLSLLVQDEMEVDKAGV